MPLDSSAATRQAKRIAIIGGGISGLAAAYLLSPSNQVTLYEAAPSFGGHARTVLAGRNGDQPVDTGFIVFNFANYPHLTQMFHDLDVPIARSDMSFGASIDGGRIEYGLRNLAALVGQKRNLVRPAFFRMIQDILRFNSRAEASTENGSLSIGDLLEGLRLGPWFERYYLLPVCGAIWSSTPDQILDFPARSIVRFFRNHALLTHKKQHQWWTVEGGSQAYVSRLTRRLQLQGTVLRAASPVQSVRRNESGVLVQLAGAAEAHDEVIFACHSDQALSLLAQPTSDEAGILGALRYQDNQMVLHADARQMPLRKACWSSWVYKADHAKPNSGVGVTYWMNRLQNIPQNDPLFVSLNPVEPVAEELIYDQTVFRHPVFDQAALNAQIRLEAIQGCNHSWFAGAYTRHGFHEDGFASAVRVVRAMGTRVRA